MGHGSLYPATEEIANASLLAFGSVQKHPLHDSCLGINNKLRNSLCTSKATHGRSTMLFFNPRHTLLNKYSYNYHEPHSSIILVSKIIFTNLVRYHSTIPLVDQLSCFTCSRNFMKIASINSRITGSLVVR